MRLNVFMPQSFRNSAGFAASVFFGGIDLDELIYVVVTTLRYMVSAMQVLLIVRAVLSWLPLDEGNLIEAIVFVFTEPILMPIRAVLEHFGLFEELPIDMSNIFAFFILSIIEVFLVI